jgi:hypothetical protein
MRKMLKVVGLVICLATAGCASTPLFQDAGRNQLFVSIIKGEGDKYRVASISNESGNVYLNKAKFTGDRTEIDCRNSTCAYAPMPEFYEAGRKAGGEKGKSFDTSRSYDIRLFSNKIFKLAVLEALTTSQLDRDKILNQYDVYVDSHPGINRQFTVSPKEFETLVNQ